MFIVWLLCLFRHAFLIDISTLLKITANINICIFYRCDAREAQLFLERQNLLEWEKKLQEGQERLLEGQRLLNQREEYTNQRDEALKQIDKELEDARKHIESDHATLKEKEADISVRLAALSTREEVRFPGFYLNFFFLAFSSGGLLYIYLIMFSFSTSILTAYHALFFLQNAVKREIIIDKKEQELIVLQEKLTSRENVSFLRVIINLSS